MTWDGLDDSANPKNWTFKRKWAATFIVSSFTFISPVSSSMVAPALQSIAKEFNITNEVEIALTLSMFVLAYGIGPLFLGPMSEIYGRVPVLQLSNLFYLVFNLACGVCTSKGQMLAFRFLSGLGGSGPLAVGNARLEEMSSLTSIDWRRRIERLLESRRTRKSHQPVFTCSVARTSSGADCWWLHRRKHDLAMGLLRNFNCRWPYSGLWTLFLARNIRSKYSSQES